VHFVILGV